VAHTSLFQIFESHDGCRELLVLTALQELQRRLGSVSAASPAIIAQLNQELHFLLQLSERDPGM
jgi:hypothetical protein